MASRARYKRLTFDDFCVLVKDGQKADLIDGVIYMASPDNTDANELFVWLISLIYDFVQYFDLGKVYGSRVAFKLDDESSPEPDIGFVPNERLMDVRRGHVSGGPKLAVEIVSPDSVARDYVTKRKKYEEAGVSEYLIVDEIKRKVTLLRLDRKGKYREVRPRNGKLHSQVLPGFWLRPDWLWQRPLPRKMDVFQEIIGK